MGGDCGAIRKDGLYTRFILVAATFLPPTIYSRRRPLRAAILPANQIAHPTMGFTMQRLTVRDFDPEVMNLFDQYVHGIIDRRGFLSSASK
jgi:hypothetical protein